MINRAKFIAALLGCSLSALVAADDLTDAAQGLCDSVKSCALEQIAKEDLTPEMRQMMEPMLESMCTNIQSKVQEVPMDHRLYKPAVACMRSMESLTCADMQNPDRMSTPECREYEKLAREMADKPEK